MDNTTELETTTELLEPTLEPSLEEIDAYLERVQAMAPTEPPCPPVLVEQAPSADVEEALAVDGRGNPKNTIDNAYIVLTCDQALAGRVALDDMTGSVNVSGALPWDSPGHKQERPWEDRIDLPRLTAYIERMYGFGDKSKVGDALMMAAADNRYDSLARFVDRLPPWDGYERIGHMAHWFLGAPDEPYEQAVERIMYRGMVARAYHPGIKHDAVTVYTGAQGLGKSTFVRRLACSDAWFSDDLKAPDAAKKDAQESLRGRWVVEIAEMSATSAADEASVKAFVSRQNDIYREPYARADTDHPRRCVMVGTSNPSIFLSDSTGNRRFFPVACCAEQAIYDVFADDEATAQWFSQALAEARDKYLAGQLPATLPEELVPIAEQRQAAATAERTSDGLIIEFLSSRNVGERVCTVQIAEQALDLGKHPKRYQTNAIAAVLDAMPELKRESTNKRVGAYGMQRCWTIVAPVAGDAA